LYDIAWEMTHSVETDAAKEKAPQIASLVAQSLTAVGKYGDAEEMLREFVKEHPDRAGVVTARSWLRKLESRGQEAMK
jgi:hypothetical protein